MANLAKCYVEAIQGGAIPCIQNALETTTQIENDKAAKESLKVYK